jgi:hypothetical protein
MLSDIDKLIKYQKTLQDLHRLKKELGETTGSYDNVTVKLPPNMVIKERWDNNEGINEKHFQFSFSIIDDVTENLRKKINYRQKKLEKKSGEK